METNTTNIPWFCIVIPIGIIVVFAILSTRSKASNQKPKPFQLVPQFRCGAPNCPGHYFPTDKCSYVSNLKPKPFQLVRQFKCGAPNCPGHYLPTDKCSYVSTLKPRPIQIVPLPLHKCGAPNCPGHISQTGRCAYWSVLKQKPIQLVQLRLHKCGAPSCPGHLYQYQKCTTLQPQSGLSRNNISVIPSSQVSSRKAPWTELFSLSFLKKQKETDDSTRRGFQPLRVFLCHSSSDKALVRTLYQRLKSDNFDPWLDEQKLLAGQDWNQEIMRAVRKADVVIVCLSRGSVGKAGYVQKEIRVALDFADEQPEGTIFLIPLRLEECEVPDRLRRWQWVNYYEENGYKKLLDALNSRSSKVKPAYRLTAVSREEPQEDQNEK